MRIAPDLVDVQLPEVTLEAWGGQNESKLPWDKDPVISKMQRAGLGVENVASAQKFRDSRRLRRLMGTPFAKKFLHDREQIMKDCTKRCIDKLNCLRNANDDKVDMLLEFKNFTLDVVSLIPP